MSKVVCCLGNSLFLLALLAFLPGCAPPRQLARAVAAPEVSVRQPAELKQARKAKKPIENWKKTKASAPAQTSIGRAVQKKKSKAGAGAGAIAQNGSSGSRAVVVAVDDDALHDGDAVSGSGLPGSPARAGEKVVRQMLFYYDFYPAADVYFDTVRHLYFYFDAGRWIMSVALPSQIQKQLGSSQRLTLPDSLPYLTHRENKARY